MKITIRDAEKIIKNGVETEQGYLIENPKAKEAVDMLIAEYHRVNYELGWCKNSKAQGNW